MTAYMTNVLQFFWFLFAVPLKEIAGSYCNLIYSTYSCLYSLLLLVRIVYSIHSVFGGLSNTYRLNMKNILLNLTGMVFGGLFLCR